MNLPLLKKVWALASSPNPGEAMAARDRARVMVEREGKTLADIPELLGQKKASSTAPQPSPDGFSFYDTNNPDHMREWAAADRGRRAKRAARETPERAEVLARYGSLDAVLAWTDREQRLRASVAVWSVFEKPPQQGRTVSITGYQMDDSGKPPDKIIRALSRAYPLPATITEAAAEYADWEQRDRDLGLVLEDTSDQQLDLPACLRREIVRDLLETGLRATSIHEVLIRQRHLVASEMSEPEIDQAVLLDLEALVAASVHNGQTGTKPVNDPFGRVQTPQPKTAGQRRAEVLRLLSNLDTCKLPDREIARRIGVSPQTVGNLRRKMTGQSA